MSDERIDEVCRKIADILKKKNADYGDSFAKSIAKWGATAYFVRDEDKTNRLVNLLCNKAAIKVDESVADTLLDKAGYAILMYLTLMEEPDGKPMG